MDEKNLMDMKSQMALRGNWKEVTRINKMLEMRKPHQINSKNNR